MTNKEFLFHYEKEILKALDDDKSSFVVGDSLGVDSMAQKFLKRYNAIVTVYHIGNSPKNNEGFLCNGGFPSHNQKDKAMTLVSDIDISWIRSDEDQKKLYGDEYRPRKSATQINIERRQKISTRKYLV